MSMYCLCLSYFVPNSKSNCIAVECIVGKWKFLCISFDPAYATIVSCATPTENYQNNNNKCRVDNLNKRFGDPKTVRKRFSNKVFNKLFRRYANLLVNTFDCDVFEPLKH